MLKTVKRFVGLVTVGVLLLNASLPSHAQSNTDQVVYTVQTTSGGSDIYLMNADGSSAQQLTHNGISSSPVWSPDGRQIAYATNRDGHWEIYLMANDGSGSKRLTTSDADSDPPAWSPDGQQIAFVSTQSGEASIYLIKASGGSAEHLLDITGFISALSWSPDGKTIAFSVTDSKKGHVIRVTNVADPTKTSAMTDASVQATSVSWAAPKPISVIAANVSDTSPTAVSSVTGGSASGGVTNPPAKSTFSLTATRPKSGAEAARYASVWTNVGFRLITSPGTQNYESSITPGKTLRFAFNWCADSSTKLKDIVGPIAVTLYVTGTKLDNSQFLMYDEGLCRKWATLVSGWKSGGQAVLMIDYTLSTEVPFRSGTVDAGEYVHNLVI